VQQWGRDLAETSRVDHPTAPASSAPREGEGSPSSPKKRASAHGSLQLQKQQLSHQGFVQYLDSTTELEAEPNADALARHERTMAASAETLDGLSDDTNYFQHYLATERHFTTVELLVGSSTPPSALDPPDGDPSSDDAASVDALPKPREEDIGRSTATPLGGAVSALAGTEVIGTEYSSHHRCACDFLSTHRAKPHAAPVAPIWSAHTHRKKWCACTLRDNIYTDPPIRKYHVQRGPRAMPILRWLELHVRWGRVHPSGQSSGRVS
jgi:hypothetical protein